MNQNIKFIKITTDFIKLGQFLKFVGAIDNGAEAKSFLIKNNIFVNNLHEIKRGKKLFKNDEIKINDECFKIL